MHEIMTEEKYVLPKIDDKKAAKKEKATLQEVREEEEEETEGNITTEEKRVTGDTVNQTRGKQWTVNWNKIFDHWRGLLL